MKGKNNFELLLENIKEDALASSLIKTYIAATPENHMRELSATLKNYMDSAEKTDKND
ncbi:MAG: hypothetical protein ABI370_03075 [Gammaproteobacteria bacterium]